MSVKTRTTIEDLYKVEGKAELVNREIVAIPPAGEDANFAGGEIFASLREHVKHARRGRAYTDGAGFHVNLPHRETVFRFEFFYPFIPILVRLMMFFCGSEARHGRCQYPVPRLDSGVYCGTCRAVEG